MKYCKNSKDIQMVTDFKNAIDSMVKVSKIPAIIEKNKSSGTECITLNDAPRC